MLVCQIELAQEYNDFVLIFVLNYLFVWVYIVIYTLNYSMKYVFKVDFRMYRNSIKFYTSFTIFL